MKRPIWRYLEELGEPFEHLVLSKREWQQAEILLLFLLPFQCCTSRFECNNATPEVDYVFFAYDTLYNHIEDVKDKLCSDVGLESLRCASFMLKAVEDIETILRKYYERTSFPTIYGDAMILNTRIKLTIFQEESWEDTEVDEYSNGCRKRFMDQFNEPHPVIHSMNNMNVVIPMKRTLHEDPEYEQHRQSCLNRCIQRHKNDCDRYIEIPNDPEIQSNLG